MLDKGQITDWDGEPEAGVAKPAVLAAGPRDTSHEAVFTGERVTLTAGQVQARKQRGKWIAVALGVFVILIFALTMAKVGHGIPGRM